MHVYALVCLVLLVQSASCVYDVYLTTVEEVAVGSVIGDPLAKAGISYTATGPLKISFLQSEPESADTLFKFSNGVLVSAARLDREQLCPRMNVCTVVLDVSVESDVMFEIIKTNIEVTDKNDNTPHFQTNNITITVEEVADTGSRFLLPAATDDDSPMLGVVGYSVEGRSSVFRAEYTNRNGKLKPYLVNIKPLDAEILSNHKLRVRAWDGGNPPLTSVLTINIDVVDMNDNKPVFEAESFSAKVPENSSPRTDIIQLVARDLDSGNNGLITYSLKSSNPQGQPLEDLAIDVNSGMVFTRRTLDRERLASYQLTVIAVDHGTPPLSTEASLLVEVTDKNDNSPHIVLHTSAQRQFTISENSPPKSFLSRVTITDEDAGENGRVTCVFSSHKFQLVHVYMDEYRLVTSEGLDREIRSSYRVTLTCRDHGRPQRSSTTNFSVVLLDENDNAPRFALSQYRVILTEDNEKLPFITNVKAEDPDEGSNGDVTYHIDGEFSSLFRVDQHGNISALVSMDYEKYQRLSFIVVAQDGGDPPRTDKTTVIIDIVNVNDEAPCFSRKEYHFSVAENQIPGTEIGRVMAIDRDASPYNYYNISINDRSLHEFSVDPKTGKIKTAKRLDRELINMYKILLKATDTNDSSLSNTAVVYVHVHDENDNPPIFLFPSADNNTVLVEEEGAAGTPVARISAYDMDSGSNGMIRYHILEQEMDVFHMDVETGMLMLSSRGAQADLNGRRLLVKVVAADNGNPQMLSDSRMYVMFNYTHSHGHSQQLGPNLIAAMVIGTVTTVFVLFLISAILCFRRASLNRTVNKQMKKEQNFTNNIVKKSPNRLTTCESHPSKSEEGKLMNTENCDVLFVNSVGKSRMEGRMANRVSNVRNAGDFNGPALTVKPVTCSPKKRLRFGGIQLSDMTTVSDTTTPSPPSSSSDGAPSSPDSSCSGKTDSGRGTMDETHSPVAVPPPIPTGPPRHPPLSVRPSCKHQQRGSKKSRDRRHGPPRFSESSSQSGSPGPRHHQGNDAVDWRSVQRTERGSTKRQTSAPQLPRNYSYGCVYNLQTNSFSLLNNGGDSNRAGHLAGPIRTQNENIGNVHKKSSSPERCYTRNHRPGAHKHTYNQRDARCASVHTAPQRINMAYTGDDGHIIGRQNDLNNSVDV